MKHAKGYREYARLDGLPYHPVQHDGYDSNGEPLCTCTYPIVGVPWRDEKPKTAAQRRWTARQELAAKRAA